MKISFKYMSRRQARLMGLIIFLVLGSVTGFFVNENIITTNNREVVHLIKTVDGDTANFETSYGNKNVRWSGVNTPETKHPTKGAEPYGVEASAFTKAKLENAKKIEIEWDTTQKWSYDRPVGIVFVDGENLNLELVQAGLADLIYLKDTMPYAQEYRKALDEAQKNKLGMWSN